MKMVILYCLRKKKSAHAQYRFIVFPNILDPWLVEFTDKERKDTEG
jgi:hypothetical protein